MSDELPNVHLNLPALKDFREAVAAGEIHYEPEAARQAAAIYDHTVEGLQKVWAKLNTLVGKGGFGGFRTGIELQRGFSKKARDGADHLAQLIDAALQLKEMYLRAGGLLEEADNANRRRIEIGTELQSCGAPEK